MRDLFSPGVRAAIAAQQPPDRVWFAEDLDRNRLQLVAAPTMTMALGRLPTAFQAAHREGRAWLREATTRDRQLFGELGRPTPEGIYEEVERRRASSKAAAPAANSTSEPGSGVKVSR